MSAMTENPEIDQEVKALQRQYDGGPNRFWVQVGRKAGELLRQGVSTAREFLRWLKEQFQLFWDTQGRDIAFAKVAQAMIAY